MSLPARQLRHLAASAEFVRPQLQPPASDRAMHSRNTPSLPGHSHVPGSLRGELPSEPSSHTLDESHVCRVCFPSLGSSSEHERPSWLQDSECSVETCLHSRQLQGCPTDTPVMPTAMSGKDPRLSLCAAGPLRAARGFPPWSQGMPRQTALHNPGIRSPAPCSGHSPETLARKTT